MPLRQSFQPSTDAASRAPKNVAAIIVAAGRGTRAGTALPKQWQPLGDTIVLAQTLAAFRASGMARIVLVIHQDDMKRAEPLIGAGVTMVAGGNSRAASVRNALEALSDAPPDLVLIHDGARPLVAPATVARVLDALRLHAGAAPALQITDALWRGTDGQVSGTQSREGLFRAQTPQGFHFQQILSAHRNHKGDAADDVEIARAAGLDVAIVPGDDDNIKLTYPQDFARADQIMRQRAQVQQGAAMDIRTGNGFDVHKFGPGDGCWLCGIKVPHPQGLEGHSDADVGMHALTDAIYGALCEGDIGQHFPPSDPQWKGADSKIFLAHAMARARERGFTLTHADVTLICEFPKIGPHTVAMRDALAGIMDIAPDRISVKATTSERLGFTGRGEGIAAMATATLVQT